jgi:C4-dicarboxylate-specific signal transduction histidine kinase
MGRKLEEGRQLLVQSAKMGAFGEMAAGVVHEIGQPLTSLQGLVELVLDGPSRDEDRSNLELIQSELERLREIVIKFRSFSKTPQGAREPVAINQVLQDTYRLLEHQFHIKGIHCVLEAEEDLPEVQGDRNALQQVLVNLIINAMDALEDQEEGKRLIELRSSVEDGQVMVSISDNGPGIPQEIQDKVFDPFFTTKGAGEGTGLGLAIIHSILHQHEGTIHLDSDPATGTRFTVLLPTEPSGA